MVLKNILNLKTLMILVIVSMILLMNGNDAFARKKSRKYNPKATRAEAIDVIRSNSTELSNLAGIEPSIDGSVQFNIDDQETLTDDQTIGDSGEDLAELESEDDIAIKIDDFKMLWLQFVTGNNEKTDYGLKKTDLMDQIMEWLGTPYKFGGTSDRAIDCSAWTQRIFVETANIMMPRTAREQVNVGRKISRNNLEFGDLIFFHTYSRRFASHVGIYLGDNLFAHASSRTGVTVSSLESTFYKKRFIGGRRLSSQDVAKLSLNKEKKSGDSQ